MATSPQPPVPPSSSSFSSSFSSSSPSSSSISSHTLTPPSTAIIQQNIPITIGPCAWKTEGYIACTCPSGCFTVPLTEVTDQTNCATCSHPMALHLSYGNYPSTRYPPALVSGPEVIGPCVVSRSKVVDELIARVQTYHIIRVRGTPASGKTTLMKLMVNKLLASDPETPVYIISGWDRKSVCEEGGWGAYLAKRTGIHGHQWLGHRGYLFLDEAQESYWDGELWASFFKTIDRTYNPYIVIFTSYGSPTEGSTGFESHLYIKTPMVFGDGQQISLRPIQSINTGLQPVGLLLDEGEANEVVEKLAPNVVANGWAALTEDLKKGLFLSSNGHVGLLTSLINILRDVPEIYEVVRHGRPVYWSTICEVCLSDPMKLFQIIKKNLVSRGLPKARVLQQPAPALIFKEAIAWDGICDSRLNDKNKDMKEALHFVCANGLLHAEECEKGTHYVFATPVHRWYCHFLYSQIVPDQKIDYDSPLQLALEAIRCFQPLQLSDAPRSVAGGSRPLEDQYQKEFYRCLFILLDGHVVMSPEFVIKSGYKGGTIDFLVTQKKWGLELLRDRDRLVPHMERFQSNGQYFSMIEKGTMEKYVVLDFTDKPPKKSRPEYHGHLYHVVFSDNYRMVNVLDASDLSVVDKFVLMDRMNSIIG